MPKGERLTAEESVKRILEQQKEKIRKIQAQDREKLRKVRARLAKEKGELQMKAAAEIEATISVKSGSDRHCEDQSYLRKILAGC